MVKKVLNQIRVLFPRWNFFDQLGHRFHLKYRITEIENWTLIEFKSQWRLLNFFCNSTHNLTLAQVSAIEQFAQEIQNHPTNDIPNLTSFLLIKSLVEIRSQSKKFQFMIEAYKDQNHIELYVSPWQMEKSP